MRYGPVKSCGVVRPDGNGGYTQRDDIDPGTTSACGDGGSAYACLDTSGFTLRKPSGGVQRFGFAAVNVRLPNGQGGGLLGARCCECYETTFTEVSDCEGTRVNW